jgi:hypothetical protein
MVLQKAPTKPEEEFLSNTLCFGLGLSNLGPGYRCSPHPPTWISVFRQCSLRSCQKYSFLRQVIGSSDHVTSVAQSIRLLDVDDIRASELSLSSSKLDLLRYTPFSLKNEKLVLLPFCQHACLIAIQHHNRADQASRIRLLVSVLAGFCFNKSFWPLNGGNLHFTSLLLLLNT